MNNKSTMYRFTSMVTKSESGYVIRVPPNVFMSIVFKALHNFSAARVILRVHNSTLVGKLTNTPYILLIDNVSDVENLIGKTIDVVVEKIELPNGTVYLGNYER